MIRFKCPSCRESVALSTGAAGAKVECPNCLMMVTVPTEVQSTQPVRIVEPSRTGAASLVSLTKKSELAPVKAAEVLTLTEAKSPRVVVV